MKPHVGGKPADSSPPQIPSAWGALNGHRSPPDALAEGPRPIAVSLPLNRPEPRQTIPHCEIGGRGLARFNAQVSGTHRERISREAVNQRTPVASQADAQAPVSSAMTRPRARPTPAAGIDGPAKARANLVKVDPSHATPPGSGRAAAARRAARASSKAAAGAGDCWGARLGLSLKHPIPPGTRTQLGSPPLTPAGFLFSRRMMDHAASGL
jgi:hypothetical protein